MRENLWELNTGAPDDSLTWIPAYYRSLFTTASSRTKSIARSLINLSSMPTAPMKSL